MPTASNSNRREVRPSDSGMVDLSQWTGVLRRRWGMLVLGLAMGLGLGAAYYSVAKVKYQSEAQILVMSKDPALATSGVDASQQPDAGINEDILATHIQLLQSREIVGQALSTNGYDKLPSITERLSADESPVTFVIDRLNVTRGGAGQSRTAHVLNIAFKHTDELETQKILTAIIASYRKFLGEKFQDVSAEAAKLISEAKVELASDLQDVEDRYRKFRQNAPLLWKGDQSSNIYQTRFEQIQEELSTLRLKRASTESRLKVVDGVVKSSNGGKVDDVVHLAALGGDDIDRLQILVDVERGDSNSAEFQASQPARLEIARSQHQSLMTLLMKEKTLLADLGPDHPAIQEVRAHIRTARDFIDEQSKELGIVHDRPRLTSGKLVEAYRELLRQDLSAIVDQEASLKKEADIEEQSAKKLIAFELDDEAMRSQIERKQELYDAVIDRLREINLVKDYGRFVTEVIAPAEAGERVSPKIPVTLAGSIFIGLCIGGFGMIAAEYRDRSFHNVEALRSSLGAPVLSIVPKLQQVQNSKMNEAIAEAGFDPNLATYYRPRSQEAEVFRGLRTTLAFNARGKRNLVVACTSPDVGDGKSTVIANLAITLAQAGRSVLLVDCDLRRPQVGNLFNMHDAGGLVDILSGLGEPPDLIRTSLVEHLSILPCGMIPANPAELLSSSAFQQFVDYARERYDFVLLDCPPVLAVADPCIVAEKADQTMLVVRMESATRPQIARTQEMLADVGVTPMGVVINGVAPEQTVSGKSAYGYGYGKNRSSSYYTDEATRPTVAKKS